MNLPILSNCDLGGRRVLLRVDLDVPLKEIKRRRAGERKWEVRDDSRIVESLETINYLLKQKAKIILLSHLGRPEGRVISEFSLKPIAESLTSLLYRNEVREVDGGWWVGEDIFLKENLRFDSGEEANDPKFAQRLTSLGDFYINDAFAVSHREHASIVGLPKLLPHAAGLRLIEEVKNLSRVFENPKRPVVVIIGGVKEDKLETIPGLLKWVDKILVGGKLPDYIDRDRARDRVVIADLDESGLDITKESAEKFTQEIKTAGTVIWAGPMGKYEDRVRERDRGTKTIAEAVIESDAFKVVGGGDTEAALTKFGLVDRIDFISSGGGAMLEYLKKGDLPGLKALRQIETE